MMDYRELCPDGGVPDEFNEWARAIVKRLRSTSPPIKRDEGHAKAISDELERIRRVLDSLSEDVRKVIRLRETSVVLPDLLPLPTPESASNLLSRSDLPSDQQYALKIIAGSEPNAIVRLRELVRENHANGKVDPRRHDLMWSAFSMWKWHGGSVPLTDNSDFVVLLERLIQDARLDFGAYSLLRWFRNQWPPHLRPSFRPAWPPEFRAYLMAPRRAKLRSKRKLHLPICR